MSSHSTESNEACAAFSNEPRKSSQETDQREYSAEAHR